MFQVVPPCGGHPSAFAPVYYCVGVSSRAPVWGASPRSFVRHLAFLVSSRAPVWGASVSNGRKIAAFDEVSSRAPVWGASLAAPRKKELALVSSRAPVWGASWQRL